MSDTSTHRYTLTITPMTEAEIGEVVDAIRGRFGRKPLIHIIGKQPSNTHVKDAPVHVAHPTYVEEESA